jgi:hypothetical protein
VASRDPLPPLPGDPFQPVREAIQRALLPPVQSDPVPPGREANQPRLTPLPADATPPVREVWVDTLNGPAQFPILGPVRVDPITGRAAMAIDTLNGTTWLAVGVRRY